MASIPFHAAIPLYHQIAQLRATERALCSEFGVSRTTEIAKRAPPPEVAAFLGLAEGAAALCIVRLHRLDGAPLSVVVSYLRFEAVIRRPALLAPQRRGGPTRTSFPPDV